MRLFAKAMRVACAALEETLEPNQIADTLPRLIQTDVDALVMKTTKQPKEPGGKVSDTG